MIFKAEMVAAILAERKTVTRRPANGPCRYTVGKQVAVQPGRGKEAVARILITQISLEPVEPAPRKRTREARAEGFRWWRDFADVWRDLYGDYDPAEMVYRIEFEVASDGA